MKIVQTCETKNRKAVILDVEKGYECLCINKVTGEIYNHERYDILLYAYAWLTGVLKAWLERAKDNETT